MSYTPNYRYSEVGTSVPDESGEQNWSYVVGGTLLVAAGAYLIFRGVNQETEGYSLGNRRLGGRATDPYAPHRHEGKGVQVRESIVIDKPVAELYRFWRRLENLPRIMSHLEAVTEVGDRSHWQAKGPLNFKPEWDALITDARENETISWRSLANSQVPNEGTVRFSPRDERSAEIIVSLTYHPPLGPAGAAVAKLFGEEPTQQIRDDLQNFKQAVESGTLPIY